MPRDYDDADDRPPDLQDFLTRLVRKMDQPGGAQNPGPDWPPPSGDDESPRVGQRILKLFAALVLVILAALGIKLGTADRDEPTRNGAAAAETLYAQRSVHLHSAPYGDSAIVDTLSPGERIIARKDQRRGWLRASAADGHLLGYAYESNGNLAPSPPITSASVNPPPASPPARQSSDLPRDAKGRLPAALCNDGTYWYNPTHAGSCSHHGGVKNRLDD